MPVAALDLVTQHQTLTGALMEALQQALSSGQFVLGEAVEAFERKLAAFCGAGHAVGVSSGTDAILLALMAMGIGPGDEVIVPAFTFFATGSCVARLGARPVFVDIDPTTFNVDPGAAAAAVTKRTKAIIPVHLYGQMADMGPILGLAGRHSLRVVEDAAQAIGARQDGLCAGAAGDIGCTSFYPTKNLSALGDAGACLTQDAQLAERMRVLRLHGMTEKYRHRHLGGNFRIDALQAAFLSIKLDRLAAWNEGRRVRADRYDRLLKGLPLKLPVTRPGNAHVYHQYTVRVAAAERAKLRKHLDGRGIGHEVYYPLPLHLQECFGYLGGREGDCPNAEQAAAEVLSLPMYPELTPSQQEEVAGALRDFFHG